ncbi:unnamed protein product [Orchesella dallaii]|uniref:Peptidase S1 domain-containing protein n=1 Tax=Orchesella dallaii TaxID=48710 RepID=A0ABP1QWN1_9HEXA
MGWLSAAFLFFALITLTLGEELANPLPNEFINHELEQTGNSSPVNNHQIVDLLIHKLKTDNKPSNSTTQLMDAASKFVNGTKLDRLVRAVENLNLTNDHVETIASELATATTPEHADKVRRAVEDAFVFGKPPPFRGPQFGAPFPGPPRFGGAALSQNPFFTIPLTSPALDIDLDRLIFLATPSLGIERAFELTKILHDLQSPRSEVFKLQESFQRNMTEADATSLLKTYEEKKLKTPTASNILESTGKLSGLNSTESKRFSRAIESLGSLNSTHATEIHKTIQDKALNSTEMKTLTKDLENLTKTQETTTPESATGQAWMFSNNSTKRAIDTNTKMFSTTRACGFSIPTERAELLPFIVTISCVNGGLITCTGTLISNEVVLTSASCILSCGSEPVTIILGNNNIGQEIRASGISAVVNPTFTNTNPSNNIGLIKFSPAVDFNISPLIFPICLLGQETDDPAIQCQILQNNQPIVTRCHQPGDAICSPLNTACVQPVNCINANHASMPVICRRVSGVNKNRYYLWGVTNQGVGSNSCVYSTSRISDNFNFAISGI